MLVSRRAARLARGMGPRGAFLAWSGAEPSLLPRLVGAEPSLRPVPPLLRTSALELD